MSITVLKPITPDAGGCSLLWYVLSQGQKSGPYGQAELVEMLRSEKISLDSYVLKKGSSVARKLFCSPEILFSHILDDSSVPTDKQQAKNDAPPPISAPTRIAEELAEEFQIKPPQQQRVQVKASGEAALLVEKEAIKAKAKAEAAIELKKQQERVRAAELAKEEALRKVAILEAKEKNKEKENKQAALAEAKFEKELRKLQENLSPPPAQFNESTTTTWRKKRKKIYPSRVANLQPKVVLEKQAPRRGPVPKQFLDKRNKGGPPSHQLPKASSEAQLRTQGDFTWAKNRVNPTAPKTVIQERTVKKNRRSRKKIAGLNSKDLKLLGIGLALICLALVFAYFLANESKRTKQPRFSLKTVTEQSHQQATVDFDEGQELSVGPVQQSKKRPEIEKQPKAETSEKRHQIEKGKRETFTKNNNEKKNSEKTQRAAGQKQREERKLRQSVPPKPTRKEAERKQGAKFQDSAKLQARNLETRPVPRGWPKYVAQNGAQLQGGLFKVISVTGIRLLQIPDFCQPCQIPAQLSDGTRLLLTSQNVSIWRNVQNRGATVVQAKGLLTRSSQGYFNVILQDLEP